MRRLIALLASVTLAVVLLYFGSYIGTTEVMSEAAAETAQPNIVFILTDDMRKDDLKYMPKTQSLLQGGGMTFQNAFVSNALCCPSRATIMRGQYSHNNGVWSNSSTDSSSTTSGGWQAYQENGNEADNVATRLDDAGYRTGLFGKYLNQYQDTNPYVPPGWDRWFATHQTFFNYDVNDNGTIKHFGGAENYQTDVLSSTVNEFISESASLGQPFFAYVATKAPHEPSTPAPRHADTFDGASAPRLDSFNESDVSDKPRWIRELPRLTATQIANIDNRHEKRIESLQAVDDLVEGVVNTLNKYPGVGSNTYIFFTSDNGWHHGEHRIPNGKWRPYEEDIRVPLLVSGPGVEPGSTTNKLALNTDYLPTFTDLAGNRNCAQTQPGVPCYTPTYVPDGRSLRPVLEGSVSTWRDAILLEAAAHYSPVYAGIRTVSTPTTTPRKYVSYAGDAKEEFYKLNRDPYERANKYTGTPPADLATRLKELKTCRAATCRTAENGP